MRFFVSDIFDHMCRLSMFLARCHHLLQSGSEALAVCNIGQPVDQSHLLCHLIGHICQGVGFHYQINTELALAAITK